MCIPPTVSHLQFIAIFRNLSHTFVLETIKNILNRGFHVLSRLTILRQRHSSLAVSLKKKTVGG